MLDRDEIIKAITEIYIIIGRPPGRVIFERLSGIGRHQWFGRFWPKWSSALQAAGLPPNPRKQAIEEKRLLTNYIGLIRTLGHVPSDGELGVATRQLPNFPSRSTYRSRFRSKMELLRRTLVFATANGAVDVVAVLNAAIAGASPSNQSRIERADARGRGFVYMMRFRNDYKIGRTNKPDRRQFELDLELPESIERIHAIETDDPSGIEAYWHRRFSDKRLNGEWFRLTRDDVTDFKRRKFM